jgi:hypothetical protein
LPQLAGFLIKSTGRLQNGALGAKLIAGLGVSAAHKGANLMNRRDFLKDSVRFSTAASLLGGGGSMAAVPGSSDRQRSPASGPLVVHSENPRYFADASGAAVLLTGSHMWNNLVDMGPSDPPPVLDYSAYLDFLERLDHNFIRLWAWELLSWDTRAVGRHSHGETHTVGPHPFARSGPGVALDGKPRFDLTRFDPIYFQRLRERVIAAGKRGIYVSIMLFEGWGIQFVEGAFRQHPFHPENNVNQIDGDPDSNGQGLEIHTLGVPAITRLQEAYIGKVVDTVNDLDNVLFEVSNENHPPSTKWQYHVINHLRKCEKAKPKQHPIGMTFQYKNGSNRALFDSPADWISPNNAGGYRDNPPVADGRKVIITDTDHLWGIGGNRAWVWKSFLRGLNPIFMDPYDGLVLGNPFDPEYESVRKSLGYARQFSRRMDLASMEPRPELASSKYCLARVEDGVGEYLVYLPDGGQASIDLSAASGSLAVEWFDPERGTTLAGEAVDGGRRVKLSSRTKGDAVVWIRKA